MGVLGDIASALSSVSGVVSPLSTIAGGVSAIGSLFGRSPEDKAFDLAKMQHDWDVAENQKNRDFQSSEWTRQFNLVNEYNDPSKSRERLMKAGLNASALLNGQGSAVGNSSSTASAPSGASGLNSIPDVVSQVGYQSQESLFRRLSLLGDLSNNSNLLPETKLKLSAEIQNLLSDSKYTEVRTNSEELALKFEKMFGKQSRSVSIQHALSEIALADAQTELSIKNGEKVDEEKWHLAVDRLLKLAQKRLTSLDAERVEKELQWIDSEKQQSIKESKSRESSNYASAEVSLTQADVNRQDRRIKSALADIEEAGKDEKIRSLIKKFLADGQISDADAKDANLRLSRILQIQDKRSGYFFKEIDGFTDWLKSKISIFK